MIGNSKVKTYTATIGRLMNIHQPLQEKRGTSCPELDRLLEAAAGAGALDVIARRNEHHGPEGDVICSVYFRSHVGTHVEAPLHFLSAGGNTASIPSDNLMGPAVVLGFRRTQVNEAITLEGINGAGEIQVGDRVRVLTGRST